MSNRVRKNVQQKDSLGIYRVLAVVALICVFSSVVVINHFSFSRVARQIDLKHLANDVDVLVIGNSEANSIFVDENRAQHAWEAGAQLIQREEQLRMFLPFIQGKKVLSNLNPLEMLLDSECALAESRSHLIENHRLKSDLLRKFDRLLVIDGIRARLQLIKDGIQYYFYIGGSRVTSAMFGQPHYRENGTFAKKETIQSDFTRESIWQSVRWRKCTQVKSLEHALQSNLAYLKELQAKIAVRGASLEFILTPFHPVFRERATIEFEKLKPETKISFEGLAGTLKATGLVSQDFMKIYDDSPELFNNGDHLTAEGDRKFSAVLKSKLGM